MAELFADDQRIATTSDSSHCVTAVSPADVSRFVRDPHGFAISAGAESAEAFMSAYLKSLEKRLDGVVGVPASAPRLATVASHGHSNARHRDRPVEGDRDQSPRMGALVVAVAAVAVVTAAAGGCTTAALFLTKPAC